MSIPPRPWKINRRPGLDDDRIDEVVDAKDYDVIKCDSGIYPPNLETAELIVRLVNAEPAIIRDLEHALRFIEANLPGNAEILIKEVLKKVRG